MYRKSGFKVLAAVLLAPLVPLHAQAAPHRGVATTDLNGIWERYPDPFADDASVFQDLQPPEGGPDLKEPYASEWKAQREKRAAMLAAGTPLVDSSTLCLPEGMPTIMGAIFAIQILQLPEQVTVLGEFLSQTRRIYIDDEMPPADELPPSYYGYSVGHWQDGALLVETRGVSPDVRFFEIPHSADMVIREKIYRVSNNQIADEIVIEDPQYLNTPYRFTFGYKRNDEHRIMEYYCDQTNDVIGSDGTVSMRVDQ